MMSVDVEHLLHCLFTPPFHLLSALRAKIVIRGLN